MAKLKTIQCKRKPRWHEKDGVIYFSVTSDGTKGEDWKKRFKVGTCAEEVLCSSDFKPTSGVTTQVAVLKSSLFRTENRMLSKIHAEAKHRKLMVPSAELACLIREKFSDAEIKAMRLWSIIVMHEPINDSEGPCMLGMGRQEDGRWLNAFDAGAGNKGWSPSSGFAFAVSSSRT